MLQSCCMAVPLPAGIKSRLKMWNRKLRAYYVERFLRFTVDDLRRELAALGVREGDTLVVHCSFAAFEGFTGNAVEVIKLLQEMVGATGTILMPSQPYDGSAIKWAKSGKPFDVKRTPSMMGIVSEFFRRMPGVVRSIHPTHPVAAWGARAKELIEDHWKAATPCGEGTPYLRMLDCDGKVLHLGSTIHTTTFLHGVEEILEPEMPFSPLTSEQYDLISIGPDGKKYETRTRLYEPYYSSIRNPEKLSPLLKERRAYHAAKVSNLRILLLRVRDLLQVSRDLAARGVYFYDTEKSKPALYPAPARTTD